jgi:hypothetical protein
MAAAVFYCGGHNGHHQKNITDPCKSQVSVAVALVVQKIKQGFDGSFVASNHAHSVSVLESVTLDRALEGFKRKNLLVSFELSEQAVLDGHQAGVFGIEGAAGVVWPVTGWPAAMRWCCLTSAPVMGTVPVVGLSLMVGSFYG